MSIRFVVTSSRMDKTKPGEDIRIKTGVWVDNSKYTGPKLVEIRKTHK